MPGRLRPIEPTGRKANMCQTTPNWLTTAIRDLAIIADDGNLSSLQFAFGEDCRAQGGLPAPDTRAKQVRHLNASDIVKAKDIARVASYLFGVPQTRCELLARDLLVSDPWTRAALQLIGEYRGRAPSRNPTPEDDKFWNPVTGGPATERWEREQREIANGRTKKSTARRRAW